MIEDSLLKIHYRKTANSRLMHITLNRKHQEELQRLLETAGLRPFDLCSVSGGRILGMTIKDMGW